MRVVLLTGKGGVGKTSLAAATALGAAEHGHRTFLLSTDPAHSLGDAFGRRIGARPTQVAPGVVAREVEALDELERSWSEIRAWLRRLLRSDLDPILSEELLVFPGLEELVALRAVREVEALAEFDVCVVDCAPTGATLRMLRFPDALRVFMENLFDLQRQGARWLRAVVERAAGPGWIPREEFFDAFERLYRDVDEVRRILLDGERTTARLVTNPARVVVDETRRSFAYLSLYGVATDAVVVNRLLPPGADGGYFAAWSRREKAELDAIREAFPIPLLRASLRAQEVIGVDALRDLAREVYGDRDPAGVYFRSRPIRLRRQAHAIVLELDLPHVSKEEIDLSLQGGDLLVRVRDARRRIALPSVVVGRRIAGARLHDAVLEVRFEP